MSATETKALVERLRELEARLHSEAELEESMGFSADSTITRSRLATVSEAAAALEPLTREPDADQVAPFGYFREYFDDEGEPRGSEFIIANPRGLTIFPPTAWGYKHTPLFTRAAFAWDMKEKQQ